MANVSQACCTLFSNRLPFTITTNSNKEGRIPKRTSLQILCRMDIGAHNETHYAGFLFAAHYPSTNAEIRTFSHFLVAQAYRWLILIQ